MRFYTLLCLFGVLTLTSCGPEPRRIKPVDLSKATEKGSGPIAHLASLSPLQRLVSSEEMILGLGGQLKKLERSAANLQLSNGPAADLFCETVEIADIVKVKSSKPVNDFIRMDDWKIGKTGPAKPGRIWQPFIDTVEYFEMTKFFFVDAEFKPETGQLESVVGFKCHAKMKSGEVAYATAKADAYWNIGAKITECKIAKWKTKEFHCVTATEKLFNDKTSDYVRSPKLAAALAESRQEDLTRRLILGESIKAPVNDKYQALFFEVTLEHPAVSVVDFDDDGLDDFFLSRRFLPSLMFRNQGDGTLKEVGTEIGLRIDDDCVCSLFADFDNDGDQDAFIGRSRQRSLYMQNNDGIYTDRSDLIGVRMPYMVSSICAADFDNNGLLDVYFSTYSPIEGSHMQMLTKGVRWPKYFLEDNVRAEFEKRQESQTGYTDVVGPPNLLLSNLGDRFAVAKCNSSVGSWRKSFQASWCDYDQDGDQDLYVCNDFAPDDLYRNEGNQSFKRVSEELGLDHLGFGMGVSWQDHNNDGHFDLYVSNMYSKAGARITKRFDQLDPRLSQMARGNYLYEFDGKKFDLVSLQGPNKTVSQTGWSWGGQMTDFDNDGNQDIVVANGYYSAPEEVEIKIDL